MKSLQEKLKTKQKPLTPERLKMYPGLQKLSDKEAEEIFESLSLLAQLCYELYTESQVNDKT
ncbi:hypothetical protein [Nibribacter koreensis]|uniref:Uncharacterized protein n=1 Tax=Nibribacter koreensis TaxID=1084519 RepID=A0ABP8FT74_9BACT